MSNSSGYRIGERTRTSRNGLALASALAIAVAGCGGDDPDQVTASPTPVPSGTTTAAPTTAAPTTPDPSTADPSTADPSTDPDDPSSGTPIDLPFGEGDVLAVIGVAADDVLNVRRGPGVDRDVAGTLAPLAEDLAVTGTARQLPDGGIWAPVEAGEQRGWVNTGFLAFLGGTDDVTAQLLPQLDDDGRAETMLDLGRAVADLRASTDPPSTITVVDGPSVGDLGEITLDVVGIGDDSIRGLRLHVFGTPDDDAGGFGLMSVEETTLCARGITDDQLCT